MDKNQNSPSVSRSKPTTPPAIDVTEKVIGAFGKYHLWLSFLLFLSKVPIALHHMGILFLAPKVSYKCDGVQNACPCPNPEYDRSIFSRTIITEWNLICGRKWLSSFSQTIFQFGTLLGSVLFGMMSDRFGRKLPMIYAVVLQVVSGMVAAHSPGYWTFTLLRFLTGISVGGTMVVGFVILIEYIGAKYREVMSAAYQMPFNFGHMLLPLFGYYFRDYSVFQTAISLAGAIQLAYICLLPETPRWLLAVHRTDEAVVILERVAKINNRPTDNIKADVNAYLSAIEGNKLKKGTIVDLFRTPNLRKNILAMACNWFSCSYCFYGVSQYVGQLSGDVFINVAASACVTLAGTCLSIPLMKIAGRKTIVCLFDFISAACLLILAFIPEGVGSVVCATIGVVSSFIVFVVVYLYCSELFPTVVRNAAIGFSSMTARIGSMIAPFVVMMRDTALWMPPIAFALVPLLAGCVTLLLPETKGYALTTTLEEGEQFGKKVKSPMVENK